MPTLAQSAVEVFYDGDCPLCRREIDMLKRWDKNQRILFTDIAAPGFDPALLGKSHEELMAQIHGRLPTGEWIIGVEVFRQLYSAVGWNWIVRWTRLPVVRQILDWAYQFFARYRLRLTGRCEAGRCSIPQVPTPRKSSG
jgi:predicted DCC family thiol-disulfide oxidoreductase YuxK